MEEERSLNVNTERLRNVDMTLETSSLHGDKEQINVECSQFQQKCVFH